MVVGVAEEEDEGERISREVFVLFWGESSLFMVDDTPCVLSSFFLSRYLPCRYCG